ncbi:BBR [Symbiodinium necroappetens]|uniref:BBR protein n=1 Tax=Symbiodinium necroappetens TaxID=1628268 RepID=A0A812M242_9DINO|nr:BBR [Symbiodinium necroappetens]
MARLVVVACGVLEVAVVIPSIFAEMELMSLCASPQRSRLQGPWPLVLLAPVIGALARCLLLPRLWRCCIPEFLRWRMQGYTGMLQAAEVRWGVAITLDMWYLLSTPLNVGLQEAWFGILLVANIFLCFVDTVTLLAALSTKPRPPAPAEGRSLHRARHVKLTPEEGMPQTCSICLCDFEEDEAAVQLPCSHVFHGECITAWLQRSRHCPMRCPELVLPPRRQSRPRGARGRPAEMLHQHKLASVTFRPRPVPQNVTQPSMAFRGLHRPRGTRLLACGIAALLLGSAFSALSFVTPRAPAPRAASRVPAQFFGSKGAEPAKYEEETLGDKIKAAWKDENTQKFIAFVATASTALDVLGLFTGEASVTAGIGEALASLDTGVALQEGQTAAEALADAAQSADFSESPETLSDLTENLKNLK